MMKKDYTEVVFILDRSGSMSGLEADTIGGFNSMINKQKKEEGQASISVVLFDDQVEILYDRVDVKKVEPMNDKQYYVRGCTALLDAVGMAIDHISKLHKKLDKEDKPDKTLFIITTDGMENASRNYTYDKLKKMVEKKKEKHGWEFLFLGANIDSISVAGRFGISPECAVDYKCDKAGTQLNYKVLSDTISAVRKCSGGKKMRAVMSECCDTIRADYEERSEHN